MTDKNKDKFYTPNLISANQMRQYRTQRLLPFFWIGAMLLVAAGGYLIYQFFAPGGAPQAPAAAGTATPTEGAAPGALAATTAAPEATSTVEPTQTAAPTPAPTEPSVVTYTVQQGDTLAGIAAYFDVDLATLAELNPQVTPEFLAIGDQLSVPAQQESPAGPTTEAPGDREIIEYTVAAGDTLALIAGQIGSTVDAIVQENGLESADQIREGQKLRIPVTPGSSPAMTPTPEP